MNLSAYQRNVLRQAGINPDVAEAIANAERQPDPFMGAFDRERPPLQMPEGVKWHDPDVEAEHPHVTRQRELEIEFLNQQHAEEVALQQRQHVQRLEDFHRKVVEALSMGDSAWAFRYRKMSEAEHAAQAIHNLFEAMDMAREDMRRVNDMREHWRNEYHNAQAQLDRTLGRRFKRLFERFKRLFEIKAYLQGPPGPPGPPGATGAMGAPGVCKCQRDDGPMGQEWK